jgi:hypothetical protein
MNKYKMSSVVSSVASPANGARFFVSINAASTIYTAAGVSSTGPAAGVVVRDMGKTIRVPGITTVGSVTSQLILRKVATVNASRTAVPAGGIATNFVGFSEGGQDTTNVYYINLYDGKWAGLSL